MKTTRATRKPPRDVITWVLHSQSAAPHLFGNLTFRDEKRETRNEVKEMKIRMTVTVDLIDAAVYELDHNGNIIGLSLGTIKREDIGNYVLEAVAIWGGQRAPGDVLAPSNIKSVRVQGQGFDLITER